MSRKRIYSIMTNTTEKSLWKYNPRIYKLVIAIFSDYDRRRKAIEKGTITGIHLEYYKLLNSTIDEVLDEVVQPSTIRKIMREDIGDGTGPYNTQCLWEISSGTFKRQKKEIIYRVAKRLQLI